MTVRANIGKLAGAIRAGQVARANVDFGPVQDFSNDMIQYSVGDWDFADSKPNAFLMTLHNWGSEKFKVVNSK